MKAKKSVVSFALSAMMALGTLMVGSVPVKAETVVYEVEDNNNRNTANAIEVNTKIIGNVDQAGDEDWYVFTTPEEGIFTYDLAQVTNSSSQCNINLYDSSLNRWSSYSRVSSCHSERFNNPKGQTFYVCISGQNYHSWDDDTDGDYELTINFTPTKKWEIEDNDNKNRAEKLTGKMKGTMIRSDDQDWFKYTAPKNGYVDFKFINEDSVVSSYGWDIVMYDKDLNELDSWHITTDRTMGTFTVKKKGIIYIKISNYSTYNPMTDYLYSITPVFKATEYVEKENNDSFKKATKIEHNKSYIGVRNSESDEDYYKFVAPSSGTFKVSFMVEDEVYYGYDVKIYGPTKKEIKTLSDLTDDSSAKIKMTKGKTYYIHVNRHSTYNCGWLYKYKVKVSKVK